MAFIKSEAVSSVLEWVYAKQILVFLRNHVFPHEQHYARCYFLHVRALDAWTNTPHEGTNRAAKHCEQRVLPTMSQAESTKTLCRQDAARTKGKRRQVSNAFHNTQLHSSTETVEYLQKEAEDMLKNQTEGAESYVSIRISDNVWLVLFAVLRNIQGAVIPVFERVRIVRVDPETGVMTCTCGHTDQYGVPDRHMAHVAIHYGTEFKSFTHHDVDLRHHTSYCRFVATKTANELSPEEQDIRTELISARNLEFGIPRAPTMREYNTCPRYAVGKSCDPHQFNSYASVHAFVTEAKQKRVSVLNHPAETVERILQGLSRESSHAAGFSQSQHNCEDSNGEEDECGDDMSFTWDPTEDDTPSVGLSAYAEGAPYTKEFLQALAGSSPAKRKWALEQLNEITVALNKERSTQPGRGAPKGSFVSAKLPSKTTNPKKQDYFGGGN